MLKIKINGYLKNVAISINTVYNLIGNFDTLKNEISFKEQDGTEIFLSFHDKLLWLRKYTSESSLNMELISGKETLCSYETLGCSLKIKVFTKELIQKPNEFYVRYQIEGQDECEYQLKWEVIHELSTNETKNPKRS